MPDIAEGSLRYDPATKSVAIRTAFEDDEDSPLRAKAWLRLTPGQGALDASPELVAAWPDTFQVVNGVVVLPDPE